MHSGGSGLRDDWHTLKFVQYDHEKNNNQSFVPCGLLEVIINKNIRYSQRNRVVNCSIEKAHEQL